ncbi:hypothetical protein [Kitasatospora sp. NPDC004531]
MPQDIPMHIPFPARVNPDAARVADEEMRWLLRFGLLRSPEAVRRHRNGDYTDLGVRFHPAATGEGLDLAIEQQSWFFLFDDQFDGPRGDDPVQAQALIDGVQDVLRHPDGRPDRPPPPRSSRPSPTSGHGPGTACPSTGAAGRSGTGTCTWRAT